MNLKSIMIILISLLSSFYVTYAAEFNPQHIDEGIHPLLLLAGESMGGYQDAMKSFLLYTASQHVPGTKESGVGYYYDNKTKRMKRNLFYRVGNGYPERTDRSLDVKIMGKGFFVVELPDGSEAYTHDGRFERDQEGVLRMMAYPFPVLGEKGEIVLNTDDVEITREGAIVEGGNVVDILKVVYPKRTHDLKSFNQSIFYLFKEEQAEKLMPNPEYYIMQGYLEESSITKAYIGLVPEWDFGLKSNVKAAKAYINSMTLAIQSANP